MMGGLSSVWLRGNGWDVHNLCLNGHMSKHHMDSQQWLFKNEESKTIEKDNRKKAGTDENTLSYFNAFFGGLNNIQYLVVILHIYIVSNKTNVAYQVGNDLFSWCCL